MAREIDVIDLGKNVGYEDALARQLERVEMRRAGHCHNTLFLLEHAPVYTLGKTADPAHILRTDGIPVVRTNRGGDVTYHGPGQITGYLIFDIGPAPANVARFVTDIETALITAVAASCGIAATRDPRNRGIWVGNDKLAAIGIRVSRGITLHGFALNVSTDLNAYAHIIPCGLADAGVTSIAKLLGNQSDSVASATRDLKPHIVAAFRKTFSPK